MTAATLGERIVGRVADGPRLRVPWRAAGIGLAAWVSVLALWELAARTTFDGTHLIGTPSGMVEAAIDNAALYGRALRITLAEAAWGFLWGNLVAIALATLVAVAPNTERLVLRVSLVFYCLPLVAVGPVLRVIFGFGAGPQITLSALGVFYTTLIPLLVGLRAIPAGWSELVSSYGRGRVTALLVVRARASVPYLAAGLQVAVPAAFLGALVGEFTGAERGVGILIIHALRSLDTDGLWALAAISAITSVVGYVLAGAVGRRLTVGQPPVLMAAPPSGRRVTTRWRMVRGAAEIVATVVFVLAVWEGFIRLFDLNNFFAKGPADVWAWLVTDPDAAANRTEILDALIETAVVAVPGYVAGLTLGAALAALFDLSAPVRRTVTPFTVALRCVPIVAIAPLLVRALGRGAFGTAVTVALMTFFPTLVACAQGLRQAPGQVMDFFDVYDVGPVRTLWSAQVPAMVPAFFAAARIAVPASILAATVAEWLATGTGMGNLMALAAGNNVYGTLWSAVVVLTTLAAAAYGLVATVERLVLARVAPEQSNW
ncbi:MAG: ABC transporter permease subunit [Actinomycetota bacterium]|nr:ABC transporter permease subunit [Actinomycetota bacterium]